MADGSLFLLLNEPLEPDGYMAGAPALLGWRETPSSHRPRIVDELATRPELTHHARPHHHHDNTS
jgi:hypothetical protein